MKNECEIVNDLLPNYIENLLSKETKEYVENHINTCSLCKRKLEIMKEDKIKIENRNEREQKVDLEHLKKYRKKFLLLKVCAIAFAMIVLFICISFIIKYIRINNILNNSNSKKQELLQLENYSIFTTSHSIDYETSEETIYYNEYYYKDGKYKKVSKDTAINFNFDGVTNSVTYGTVDSNEELIINDERKEIIEYTTNYKQVPKSRSINRIYESISFYFNDFSFFENLYIRSSLVFQNNLRIERFQGRECYVLRAEEKNSYTEIWIDKENYLPIREIQDRYGKTYKETIISFYIDKVKYEDVNFNPSQYEDYTIKNKEYIIEDERTREIYENI